MSWLNKIPLTTLAVVAGLTSATAALATPFTYTTDLIRPGPQWTLTGQHLFHPFYRLEVLETPGSAALSFNAAAAGTGIVSFAVRGLGTTDGTSRPDIMDTFSFFANDSAALVSLVIAGPGGAPGSVILSQIPGSNVVLDPRNSIAYVQVPVFINAGINQFLFSYAGVSQGLADEYWALSGNISLVGDIGDPPVTDVPEPAAAGLAGIGLLGVGFARRKQRMPDA
jgi:hypothetical protein